MARTLHEIEARTGIAIAVELDAELNAMEMSTLPDNSGRRRVAHEGDPAAVAEDNGDNRRRRRGGRNRARSNDGDDAE